MYTTGLWKLTWWIDAMTKVVTPKSSVNLETDLLWMIWYVISHDVMLCMQFGWYLYHLWIFENNTSRRKYNLLTSWPFLNYFTCIYVEMISDDNHLVIYCEIITFRRKIMSLIFPWKWQKRPLKASRKMVHVER